MHQGSFAHETAGPQMEVGVAVPSIPRNIVKKPLDIHS